MYTNIFVYKKCTSVYLQSRFHQRDRWLSPPHPVLKILAQRTTEPRMYHSETRKDPDIKRNGSEK